MYFLNGSIKKVSRINRKFVDARFAWFIHNIYFKFDSLLNIWCDLFTKSHEMGRCSTGINFIHLTPIFLMEKETEPRYIAFGAFGSNMMMWYWKNLWLRIWQLKVKKQVVEMIFFSLKSRIHYLGKKFIGTLGLLEGEYEGCVRSFQNLMEGEVHTPRSRKNEIGRYLTTEPVKILSEYSHESNTQLDEFEVSIDHEVPGESLAETCHPHPKIGSLERQWTELWRYYVTIVVSFVLWQQSLLITFRRYTISTKNAEQSHFLTHFANNYTKN